jgi:hypothetical protein
MPYMDPFDFTVSLVMERRLENFHISDAVLPT